MKNQRNEIIRFGKYIGKTIGEIYFKDPKYLLWADINGY